MYSIYVSWFQAAIPKKRVKGCTFHYAKAMNAHMQDVGLAVVYRQNDDVNTWFRRLRALCLCPEHLVRLVANDLLWPTNGQRGNLFPEVDDARIRLGMIQFSDYFVRFWLNDALIPIWNNYDNDGPRTTNHAEGTFCLFDEG